MYKVAMDVGKYRTYGIIERDGEVVKDGSCSVSRTSGQIAKRQDFAKASMVTIRPHGRENTSITGMA